MTNNTTGALSVIEDALKAVGRSRDDMTYLRAMDKCEIALALCQQIRDEVHPKLKEVVELDATEDIDEFNNKVTDYHVLVHEQSAKLLQKICEVK